MEEVSRGGERLKNQLKREEDGEEGGEKKTEVGWRVRGGKGKCWSPMLSISANPLCFFSGTQTRTGLAPGYSPVYTAPTLLQLYFPVAWPIIYSFYN